MMYDEQVEERINNQILGVNRVNQFLLEITNTLLFALGENWKVDGQQEQQ